MAYKIIYSAEPAPQQPSGVRNVRLRTLIAVFLLIFALGVRFTWPAGTQKLREYLVPGTPTVTEAAFTGLLHSIQSGEPLADALHAFCSAVIHEAR